MAIAVVQLGSPRKRGEGLRLGTVRRPPRGVPKSDFAKRDFYDVWLPILSPSPSLLSTALQADDPREWNRFVRAFRREMKQSAAERTLDLLAALSRQTHFAIGCYCANEARCHRSVLRELLAERGAALVP